MPNTVAITRTDWRVRLVTAFRLAARMTQTIVDAPLACNEMPAAHKVPHDRIIQRHSPYTPSIQLNHRPVMENRMDLRHWGVSRKLCKIAKTERAPFTQEL